jgi:hypothetical protein
MIRRLAALAALSLSALPLAAQAPRLPVVNNGVPRGVFLAGDIGLPNDAAGGGETYAATGGLGLGSLGFTATTGSTSPDVGNSEAVYGGTANLRLIGGPLIPFFVNLQGGAGYANFNGRKTTHVPVGVGIGLTIPLPVFGVKPWFAPRWDYTSVSRTGFNRNSTSVFGYSAGLDLAFIFGLGIRAAYDWANIGTDKPKIWSIGAKWSFGV